MSEDVSINKFFDEAMMVELAQQAADLHQQMMWFSIKRLCPIWYSFHVFLQKFGPLSCSHYMLCKQNYKCFGLRVGRIWLHFFTYWCKLQCHWNSSLLPSLPCEKSYLLYLFRTGRLLYYNSALMISLIL